MIDFNEIVKVTDIIAGPPNKPVLFRWLMSFVVRRLSSSVTLPAVGPAGRRVRGRLGGRHCTAGQSCYVPLGRYLVYVVRVLMDSFISQCSTVVLTLL